MADFVWKMVSLPMWAAHKEDMQAEEVIDMKGAVVMPALANGHTHLP